jgi:hypothetical protein
MPTDDDRSALEGATAALAAARAPRERLWSAADALARSIAAPAPGRIERWRTLVAGRLATVRDEWEHHVVAAEADDGLFAEIMTRAPRLAHAIDRLRGEHTALRARMATLATGAEAVTDDGGVAASREGLLELVSDLARHRHRGVDLVYEAYDTDISAGD